MNDCRECFYQFDQQSLGGTQHYCERFDRMLQVSKAGKIIPYRPCSGFWFKSRKECIAKNEQSSRRISQAINSQANTIG